MPFEKSFIEKVKEGLLGVIGVIVLVTLGFVALFACWFVARFLLELMGYFARGLFSEPW